jgi:hypothetical protein
VDRHPPPQNLPLPPLRHPLNLQSLHVSSREARGVPSYVVSYATHSDRWRRDGYLGGARTASSAFTLLVSATPVASFSDMFILGIYSAADIRPSRSCLRIEVTLTDVSHRKRNLCWLQYFERKGAYDSCCLGVGDRSVDVRVR